MLKNPQKLSASHTDSNLWGLFFKLDGIKSQGKPEATRRKRGKENILPWSFQKKATLRTPWFELIGLILDF